MAWVAACGSDESSPTTCTNGEQLNPISGECEPRREDPRPDVGADANVQPDRDADGADSGPDESDTGSDSGTNTSDVDADMSGLTCTRDADGDGHVALECGGDDCDDLDGARSPSRAEICDEIDNNCNQVINDAINCSFYVHSDTTLYQLDPFKRTLTEVAPLPGLYDIDTHPDGTLYGLSPEYLYRFDASAGTWSKLPQGLGADVGNANGMAIDSEGNVFITSGNKLYGADLTTGVAQFRGNMGGFYNSSGDCVVTKQDVLYMTSSHTFTDSLVLIDGINAATTLVGNTGFTGIWALTSAWGRLWGMTSDGELVELDRNTGRGTLVHSFAAAFYGAASTPER